MKSLILIAALLQSQVVTVPSLLDGTIEDPISLTFNVNVGPLTPTNLRIIGYDPGGYD